MNIIILAAGLGTRMRGGTETQPLPKVMHEVSGKPMLAYVLETAGKIDRSNIIAVVGHGREIVGGFLAKHFPVVKTAVQQKQSGSGDAVRCAETLATGPETLILEGDTPLLSAEMLNGYIKKHRDGSYDLSFISFEPALPTGYGRVLRKDEKVAGIVEEKDASDEIRKIKEVNSGVYFGRTGLIFSALKKVKNDNAKKEYYLTDIVKILLEEGYNVGAINFGFTEEFLGVNTPENLKKAEAVLKGAVNGQA